MSSATLLFLAALVVANVFCLAAFGSDKHRARTGKRRIPEQKLHLVSLPFASLGALAGIFLLRHKSGKPSFWIVTVVITLLQLAIVYLYLRRG